MGLEANGVRTPERLPADPRLSARFGRGPAGGPAQVHVRHRWPPQLEPPPHGPLGVHAALGVRQPAQGLAAGSAPGRRGLGLQPLGPRLLPRCRHAARARPCHSAGRRPGGLPARTRSRCRCRPGPDFRFLFVGGTIYRKGIDLLLAAFARAFRPSDGVGLVIKDMGTQSFYRGQTAEAAVAELRERGYPVEYIDRALDERELAGLYAACDCLVHPYRGEGFALPVVEAMACGLPAIVTGAGPALDYAAEATAFLVPARRARIPRVPRGRPGDGGPALAVGAGPRCPGRAAPPGGVRPGDDPGQGSGGLGLDPRALHLVAFGGCGRSPAASADGVKSDDSGEETSRR